MKIKLEISYFKYAATILAIFFLVGCVGRTGKVGTPISATYREQLAALKLGESSPDDLKKCFGEKKVSLKEAKIENDTKVEIWEVAKSGNMNAAAFIMWGYIAYDKDQSLLFRFENNKLVSYQSIIRPDSTDNSGTNSVPVKPIHPPKVG